MKTRTTTGAIKRVNYSLTRLRLRGEDRIHKAKRAPRYRRSSKNFRNVRAWSPLPADFLASLGNNLVIPPGQMKPGNINYSFASPVIFGREDAPLSIIQRADLHIENIKKLITTHEQHLPSAVPVLKINLIRAEDARALLEDTEENHMIENEAGKQKLIQERIESLESILAVSNFVPEQKNIQCAIQGYKDGEILYSELYTLIWAGRIVGTAATYAEFAADRHQRLDDYQKQYGDGWFWYEGGLKQAPRSKPRLSLAAGLVREPSPHGLGQYYVNQSYTKRADWINRLTPPAGDPLPEHLTRDWIQGPFGSWWCGQTGPKITFHALLDSGATFPSLYVEDFRNLGIDDRYYAAQTIVLLQTANGAVCTRLYEMDVTVQGNNGQELVDPIEPVWPNMPAHLGGICPVAVVTALQPSPTPEAIQQAVRLSGVIPFLACYVSSVPTRNRLFLGEDRNDVVGAGIFAGQKRWAMGMSVGDPIDADSWPVFGQPKITFNHRFGQVIDRDFPNVDHASEVVANEGAPNQFTCITNPRAQIAANQAYNAAG